MGKQHQPLRATTILAHAACQLSVAGPLYADLLGPLENYLRACSVCERITRTPIPLPYSK